MRAEMGEVPCVSMPVGILRAAVPSLSLAPGPAEGAGRQALPRQMKHGTRK